MNEEFSTWNEDDFARHYSRLVSRCVRPLFLQGGDYDDLYQEGMIGLLQAVRKYDPDRSDSFEAFATLCIKNRLYDAVRKHAALSEKDFLVNQAIQAMADRSADEILNDPEAEVLANESAKEIKMVLSGLLSAFEASVLDPYLEGYTALEIAGKLNKPVKSVDNAIRRIRNKLKRYLLTGRQQV